MNAQHPLYDFLQSKKSHILYLFFVIEAALCAAFAFVAPLLIRNLASDTFALYFRLLYAYCIAHIFLSSIYAAAKALILSGKVHMLRSYRKIRFIRYILTVILIPFVIYTLSTDPDSLISDTFSTAVHIYTALLFVFFLIYNASEMKFFKALSFYPNPPKKSPGELISYFPVISTVFGSLFAIFTFAVLGVSIFLLVSSNAVFTSLSEVVMVFIMITVPPFLAAKFFICASWAKMFMRMQFNVLFPSSEPKAKTCFNTNENASIYRKED